ncbi:hypothetical protein JCM10213_004090 [Rhodosporidiobolus nylandii]
MAAQSETHYSVLGVPRDATSEEIRSAYLVLAKAVHPDRVPAHEKAEANVLFTRLAAAYGCLSDPERRRAYDLTLTSSASNALVPFTGPTPTSARPPSPARFRAPPLARPASQPLPYRHPPSPAPQSPFPGYRVPPGGYPHTPGAGTDRAFEQSFGDEPLFGDGREAFFPSSPLFSSAFPGGFHGQPPPPPPPPPRGAELLPPLSSFDPFSVFASVMELQRSLPFPPPHHPHPPHFPHHPPHHHPHHPHHHRRTRSASASWQEVEKHRNGDWSQTSGVKTVEERDDGAIRWTSATATVSYSSGRPHHPHYPHLSRRPSYDGLIGSRRDGGLLLDDPLAREEEQRRRLRALEEYRRKDGYGHGYGHGHGIYQPLPPPLYPPHKPLLPYPPPHRPPSPGHHGFPHHKHAHDHEHRYPHHHHHHHKPIGPPSSSSASTLFGGGSDSTKSSRDGALVRKASLSKF